MTAPHPHVDHDHQLGTVVRGTRVAVRRLWAWHRRGIAIAVLVQRYPSVGWARMLDALSYAYDNQDVMAAELDAERALVSVPDEP